MPHLLSLHSYGGYSGYSGYHGYHGYSAKNIHLRPNHIVIMVMQYASSPVSTRYGGYSGYCGYHGYGAKSMQKKTTGGQIIW